MPHRSLKTLVMSAFDQNDLTLLKETVQELLTGGTLSLKLPADRGDLIALAYRCGEVKGQSVEEESVLIELEISKSAYELHGHPLRPYTQL